MPSSRRCVIKQLKPTSADPSVYQVLKERFAREASILERLGRDNDQIPTLHAYFAENKEFYLVQDWIDGRTLGEKYRYEGMPTKRELCVLISSLLTVLEFVHGRRMIHLDIKPDNVIIRGSDGKPVLIDFGAVKEVVTASIDSQGRPKMSSVIIGTPGYMPPEQEGKHPVFSSDLYSLSLTAIFLLTGKHPHEMRDSITGEMNWHQYVGALDPALVLVLDKATQRVASARYQSAAEMNRAIRDLMLVSPNKIKIPIPAIRSRSPLSPRTLLYAAGGLMSLLLLAGGLMVGSHLYRNGVPKTNPSNTPPKPTESTCVLYNDDPSQQTVNVRANCDKKSCDLDASTILGEYPNNTAVRINLKSK